MKFKNKIIYAVLIILLINTNYVFAEKSDSIKNEIEDNKNKIRDAIEESQKGIYLVNDVISCNDELSDDDDL